MNHFREKKIKISQNNIFNYLNYKTTPIHESLNKLLKFKKNY